MLILYYLAACQTPSTPRPTLECENSLEGANLCVPTENDEVFHGCMQPFGGGNTKWCEVSEPLDAFCMRELGMECPTYRELLDQMGWVDGGGDFPVWTEACTGSHGQPTLTIETQHRVDAGTTQTQDFFEFWGWWFDECGRLRAVYRDHLADYDAGWPDSLPTWCCDGHETQYLIWGDERAGGGDCVALTHADFEADPMLGTCYF